jgi:hypothetical protein
MRQKKLLYLICLNIIHSVSLFSQERVNVYGYTFGTPNTNILANANEEYLDKVTHLFIYELSAQRKLSLNGDLQEVMIVKNFVSCLKVDQKVKSTFVFQILDELGYDVRVVNTAKDGIVLSIKSNVQMMAPMYYFEGDNQLFVPIFWEKKFNSNKYFSENYRSGSSQTKKGINFNVKERINLGKVKIGSIRYIIENKTYLFEYDQYYFDLINEVSKFIFFKDRLRLPLDSVFLRSLRHNFKSANDTTTLTEVFTFCQNAIEYKVDTTSDLEYLLPIQTLLNKGGDCEDFAILFATLATNLTNAEAYIILMGVDSVSIDHATAGIKRVGSYSNSTTTNDIIYCDPIAIDEPMGYLDPEFAAYPYKELIRIYPTKAYKKAQK